MKIKKGFTLIELTVVVGIMVILSSMVIINVNKARLRSRDAQRISDMNTISQAVQGYYMDKHALPASSGANYATVQSALTGTGKYMARNLSDPKGGTDPCGVTGGYSYNFTTNGTNWAFMAVMEDQYTDKGTVAGSNCTAKAYILRNGEVYTGDWASVLL